MVSYYHYLIMYGAESAYDEVPAANSEFKGKLQKQIYDRSNLWIFDTLEE